MLRIAYIAKAHGIKGEVRVIPYNLETPIIKKGNSLYMEENGNYQAYEIENAKIVESAYLVKFKGINSRNESEKLRSKVLLYPKKLLPKLNKDEFYQFEIIGKKAFYKGKCIGVISGFMGQNSSELIVIDRKEFYTGDNTEDKGELLIPFVDEFIEKFDQENDIFYFKNIDELL